MVNIRISRDDLLLLERLTSIAAVAGHEDEIIEFLYEEFQKNADVINIDKLGNIIVEISTREEAPRLMFFAHMDEIGLCVSRIEPNGFIRVQRIGGVNRKALLGQRVVIRTNQERCIPGIIGVMSHHFTPEEERFRIPDVDQLYIDVGADSAGDVAMMGIKIGAPVSFSNHFEILGGKKVSAKALDNRIGLFVLLKIAECINHKELKTNLFLAATVQEEFHLRGVLPVVHYVRPDAAICLDTAVATDTPDLYGKGAVTLGGGPVLGMLSFHGRGTLGGLVPNPGLVTFVESVANALDIPLQRQAVIGWLTDSSFMTVENFGIPAADIAVPIRYSHTPVEIAELADIEKCVNLMIGVVHNFSSAIDLRRGRRRKEGNSGGFSA